MPILISGNLNWFKEKRGLQKKSVYCICDCSNIDTENMIRCSNFKMCVKVWFHLKCLNLDVKPKGKRFCPYCKK